MNSVISRTTNSKGRHQARNLNAFRKDLGVYYTPQALTDSIAAWAIRDEGDTVLEPSFGGCNFLAAAYNRLKTLGVRAPIYRLAGCDVHAKAFTHLADLFGSASISGRFLKSDFLTVSPVDFIIPKFTCVIGNPPFVSHHRIRKSTKDAIRRSIENNDSTDLSQMAGLWAHFLIRALDFLQRDGRLAFILPSSFLFADYASHLRAILPERFRHCRIVRLNYHAFHSEGVEEKPILVLADGFGTRLANLDCRLAVASNLDQAKFLIRNSRTKRWGTVINGHRLSWNRNTSVPRAYSRLTKSEFCSELGDLVSIDIGVVTGANKHFVLSSDTIHACRLPRATLTPVISRAAQVQGISYRAQDHASAIGTGARCWLFAPKALGSPKSSIRRYLARIPMTKRRNTLWFKKRPRWYRTEIGELPDAIFTYMNHFGPRLILPNIEVTCTNTLHRVWFDDDINMAQRSLIAVSLLTSFSQISAELGGRQYGGGVLKLEPSEARQLKLILPGNLSKRQIRACFNKIDKLLKGSHLEEAIEMADDFILRGQLGHDYRRYRHSMLNALEKLRAARHNKARLATSYE